MEKKEKKMQSWKKKVILGKKQKKKRESWKKKCKKKREGKNTDFL